MSTGHLFLHFDPPATAGQLAIVAALADDYDKDMPVKRIGAGGTGRCECGRDIGDEHGIYWRKPGFEAEAKTIEILSAAGINGHGWLVESLGGDTWGYVLPDEQRFTFGLCPAMRERIDKARVIQKADSAIGAAMQALVRAAQRGRDDALPALAQAYREAVAARESLS